jgi:pimeloyl-ACP methyl ester carboxylesterase
MRLQPEEATMNTLSSHDGTTIAYDTQGEGPALILVDGALTVHSSGSGELATLLAPRFTVYGFDRRDRGESGDTLPYAVDREIDETAALIDRAGGSPFLYGHSSGGPLATRAAIRLGSKVSRIALYEPPYNTDPGAQARRSPEASSGRWRVSHMRWTRPCSPRSWWSSSPREVITRTNIFAETRRDKTTDVNPRGPRLSPWDRAMYPRREAAPSGDDGRSASSNSWPRRPNGM